MARGGIRLVHEFTKSTLFTYFSGMKIDTKKVFLQAYFLICLSYDQKHTLFPRFCTPKRCTHVHYLALKNNPNYVNFWTSLIPPLTFEWPPPPPGLCMLSSEQCHASYLISIVKHESGYNKVHQAFQVFFFPYSSYLFPPYN